MTKSTIILITLVIKLILAGIDSKKAVERVTKKSEMDFASLWKLLPDFLK